MSLDRWDVSGSSALARPRPAPEALLGRFKGGPTSGHWGHRGRPGYVGGSLPKYYNDISSLKATTGYGGERDAALVEQGRKLLRKGLADESEEVVFDQNIRSQVKHEIVSRLSEQTGIPYTYVNELIRRWALTSNDIDYRSLSIQEMAAKIFGGKLSEWQKERIAETRRLPPDDSGRQKALHHLDNPDKALFDLLTTMYNNTQELFRENGIKELILYRGFKRRRVEEKRELPEQMAVEIRMNSLESWSASYRTAEEFAAGMQYGQNGYVLAIRIPVERVFCCARTGFGCLREEEFVVIGGMEDDWAFVERKFRG